MSGWRALATDRPLYLAVLGIGWFATYAVVLLGVLRGTGAGAADLTTLIAAGVALGAIADWHLSQGHNELGLVPFGSLGMTVLAFAMAALPDAAVPARAGVAVLNGAFVAWFVRPLIVFVRDRRGGAPVGVRIAATVVSVLLFTLVGAALMGRNAVGPQRFAGAVVE